MSDVIISKPATGAASYGGFADAIGGIATVVLAIVALDGIRAELLVAVATIIFGAALLIQGGTTLSEYAQLIFPAGELASGQEFGGGSLSALFLAGAAGIVLGVLALIGVSSVELTAIAVIAFGGALILSSNAVWHLYLLRRSSRLATEPQGWRAGSEMLAGEVASGTAGMQAVGGLASVVLGILAVVGNNPVVLIAVALLVLGAAIVLTGGAMSAMVMSFMRPMMQTGRGASPFGG